MNVMRVAPAFAVIATVTLASGASSLSGFVPQGRAPVAGISLPEVHAHRPPVAFHFKAAAGHTLFVYFGYASCPDVCPTTLSDLKRALGKMGDRARLVDVAFVTVDPERDQPQLLEPYLTSFIKGAHPLRPSSRAQLETAERAFGAASSVSRDSAGFVEVSHTATSYLVDDSGRIVDEWSFGTTPAAMAADLNLLLDRGKR